MQQRGNLNLPHALDLDLSPGTAAGADPSLSYNSERVSVQPILQVQVQSDNAVALPATITAQLTWNGGAPQTAQNFSTTGRTPGELLILAQQVNAPVSTT